MLEPAKFTKQMIDFQKASFGSAYNAISLIQDQTERMANLTLEKAPWFPEEGKKALDDWADMCKKGREEFKASVISSFDSVKSLLDETVPTETKTQ
jgi:hypothetical protein